MLNDGSGNFIDRTPQVFGSLPGFSKGALAVAQFTNDSMPDLIHIGSGSFCGPRVLLQQRTYRRPPQDPALRFHPPSDSSSSILAAALGGGLGGGLGFLLLMCACCCVLTILCCCCAVCLIVIFAIVAVALVAIVAVAIGHFAAGDAGVVFFLVRGKKGKKEDPLFDVELDALDVAALRAEAERIDEYRVVEWSDIKPIRKLGEGAFGEVLLAEWNGVEVAVKIFKNATKEAAEDFKHEAVMMAKVAHHPHVVRFIGAAFKDGSIAMVLALCSGGSLLSALEKKKLDAAAKTRILRETASALSFLHSLGIVHRDIAARNVLLDGHGVAKLADLGMSRVLEDKQGEQTTANNVGPIRWMAIRSKKYSAASDCVSFAILMVEVWSDGHVPYAHIASLVDVAMAVLNSNESPRIPESMPLIPERLLRRLWDRDPSASVDGRCRGAATKKFSIRRTSRLLAQGLGTPTSRLELSHDPIPDRWIRSASTKPAGLSRMALLASPATTTPILRSSAASRSRKHRRFADGCICGRWSTPGGDEYFTPTAKPRRVRGVGAVTLNKAIYQYGLISEGKLS